MALSIVISSAPVALAAPPGAPAAPSGLTATVVSASQVDLAWVDNSGDETGFHIQRMTDGTTFDVAAGVTSYSDTPVSADHTYQYRVLATNVVGDSEP